MQLAACGLKVLRDQRNKKPQSNSANRQSSFYVPIKFGGGRLHNNGKPPAPPYTREYVIFRSSCLQCTNHNVKTEDQISMKFGGYINIICRIGTCLII